MINNKEIMATYLYMSSLIWKEIPNFPNYKISNFGIIISKKRPKTQGGIIKPSKFNKNRHLNVTLYKNNKKYTKAVHRLVLEAFIGFCPQNMECCHNDGNGLNNRLDNLRWDTPNNNQQDKIQHGNSCFGEKNGSAKLTEKQVKKIRKKYIPYKYTLLKLSKEYHISIRQVYAIITNENWRHI